MQQETYIEQYPNAFTKEFCDKIITRFEEMAKNNGVGGGKSLRKASDTRTVYDWAPHYDMFYHDPKLVEEFYSTMHKHYLTYMEKYGVLKESVGKHTPKGMSIQRTDPKEGYHIWHVESESLKSSNRVVVYMLYLNTVLNGGETEFLYQGVKTNPVAGKLVFFPATWQHPHRGNPIYEGHKYIITGWYIWDE
jgi:hypothetical protein